MSQSSSDDTLRETELKVDEALFSIFARDNAVLTSLKESNSENDVWKEDVIKNLLLNVINEQARLIDCINLLVKAALERRRCVRSSVVFRCLEAAIRDNRSLRAVGAKVICESILNSKLLTVDKPRIWVEAFGLIRRIITFVDYKGVRDLLKCTLISTRLLPTGSSLSHSPCIDAVFCLIEYIINRNNCLLPGFLAVNEIYSRYQSEEKPWPHWRLGQLLADYMQSFRPAAKLLTISGRNCLKPVVGITNQQCYGWKLHTTGVLKLVLSGPLPWDKELNQTQNGLVRYVLEQAGCNVYLMNMLNLQGGKQSVKVNRCVSLENELIDMAMEALLKYTNVKDIERIMQRISSTLVFLVMYHFVNFPDMINNLLNRLQKINVEELKASIKRGRSHLMWLLLQFLSGSISKHSVTDFLPVLKVIDVCYRDDEEVEIPCIDDSSCVKSFAAVSIWTHVMLKATADKTNINRKIPAVLSTQYTYLEELAKKHYRKVSYPLVLIANAYSTQPDNLTPLLNIFLEEISGSSDMKIKLAGDVEVPKAIRPLSIEMMDSWTVHTKMSFVHMLVKNKIVKGSRLSPALVETYARLLSYSDIESFGIKSFVQQFFNHFAGKGAYETLHIFVDLISNRLHFIQGHYVANLLISLFNLLNNNLLPIQLQTSIESACLRLIMKLNENFFHKIEPTDNEEMNRVIIYSLARTVHMGGAEGSSNNQDFIKQLLKKTPLFWSSQTQECFPHPISDNLHSSKPMQSESTQSLMHYVDIELNRWKSGAGDFKSWIDESAQPYFLCVLYRLIKETGTLTQNARDMLEILRPKHLSQHVRKLADYVVVEFSSTGHVQQVIDVINEMIWKIYAFPLEKLVLCLALRHVDGVDPQVAFNVLNHLLFKPPELRNRINEWVKETPASHWLDHKETAYEIHTKFHSNFPEKWVVGNTNGSGYLPTYYSSVCSRFIPYCDILIQRCIEVEQASQCFYKILEHFGKIYKLHDHPITFLYNTLYYYERLLRNRPDMKRILVATVNLALRDARPQGWAFTTDFERNVLIASNGWKPNSSYYIALLRRLSDTLESKPVFPEIDWRFNEIVNVKAHCVYVTCVELMTLHEQPSDIGNHLIDIAIKSLHNSREEAMQRMNAVGLILMSMPEPFGSVLNDLVIDTLRTLPPEVDFTAFDFYETMPVGGDAKSSRVLAIAHSCWQHGSIGQLSAIPCFIREKIRPLVKNEHQFLFVCKLIGPFLFRLAAERTRCVLELTVELYEMLERVDRYAGQNLLYMDTISDFFYDIKYMYVGDGVKSEVDKIISRLRNPLKTRLSFISHQARDQDANE